MFKSSSLVLYLYITFISIIYVRNQHTNKLIVLNNKPYPIYLSSSKNTTHYFIITSGESLCIEIKTGNIVFTAGIDNYESFYVHFTDQSNKDYFYRLASIGYFEITASQHFQIITISLLLIPILE